MFQWQPALALLALTLTDRFRSMTRRSQNFRQADVERAVKAALSVGLTVNSFEISQSGTIRVITTNVKGENTPDSPYDEWKAKRDAGSTQRYQSGF